MTDKQRELICTIAGVQEIGELNDGFHTFNSLYRRFRLSELPDIYYPHITHQMACAWLREVHNMHIDIDPSEGDWHPCVIELETWSAISDGNLGICDTYEDAVEAALKYALENLI